MLTGNADADRRFYTRLTDHHLVVIDIDRQELRVLNPSAGALWLLSGEGERSEDQLADALAGLFGLTRDQVATDVGVCLDEWATLGWVERVDPDGRLRIAGGVARSTRPGEVQAAAPGEETPVASLTEMRIAMVGADVVVRLGLTLDSPLTELTARVQGLLSGFPVGIRGTDSPAACLTFIAATERIWVETPDGLVWSNDPSEALSHLILHMLLASGSSAPLLATLHAAAMGRAGGDGLLVMPGLSGNGKSTLTAYLAAHGWKYAGDDIVALTQTDDGRLSATPFPTAVSLKPGSWELLAGLYPQVRDLPTISYAGKKARFLALPAEQLVGGTPQERAVRSIIFPRFDPSARGEAELISTLDGLLELITAGFTAGDRLDRARLDRFFDFLEATPMYRLSYPTLEAAEQCLTALAS